MSNSKNQSRLNAIHQADLQSKKRLLQLMKTNGRMQETNCFDAFYTGLNLKEQNNIFATNLRDK